jgi:hypothetical protein
MLDWGTACAADASNALAAAAAAAGRGSEEASGGAGAGGGGGRDPYHPRFGYLTVRVEDLLPPVGIGTNFNVLASSSSCTRRRSAAIAKIAAFVGAVSDLSRSHDDDNNNVVRNSSQVPPGDVRTTNNAKTLEHTKVGTVISAQELCCLCAEPPPFLGGSIDFDAILRHIRDPSSSSPPPEPPPPPKTLSWAESPSAFSSYGKWRQYFLEDSELASVVTELTANTNRRLGYTPLPPSSSSSSSSSKLSSKKPIVVVGGLGHEEEESGRRRQEGGDDDDNDDDNDDVRFDVCGRSDQGEAEVTATEGSGDSESSAVVLGRSMSTAECARQLMRRVLTAADADETADSSTVTTGDGAGSAGVGPAFSSDEGDELESRRLHRWNAHGCEFLSHFSVIGSSTPSQSSGQGVVVIPAQDAESCCVLCQGAPVVNQRSRQGGFSQEGALLPLSCRHFAFEAAWGSCHLMGPPGGFSRNSAVVSGWPVKPIAAGAG